MLYVKMPDKQLILPGNPGFLSYGACMRHVLFTPPKLQPHNYDVVGFLRDFRVYWEWAPETDTWTATFKDLLVPYKDWWALRSWPCCERVGVSGGVSTECIYLWQAECHWWAIRDIPAISMWRANAALRAAAVTTHSDKPKELT